ncbi:MAG: hypothetical protein AAGI53_09950 [Planctomycetota bacterium]
MFRALFFFGAGAYALISGLKSGDHIIAFGLGLGIWVVVFMVILVTYLSHRNKSIVFDSAESRWSFRNFVFARKIIAFFPIPIAQLESSEIFEAKRVSYSRGVSWLQLSTTRGVVRVPEYVQPFSDLVDATQKAAEITPDGPRHHRPVTQLQMTFWAYCIGLPAIVVMFIIAVVFV